MKLLKQLMCLDSKRGYPRNAKLWSYLSVKGRNIIINLNITWHGHWLFEFRPVECCHLVSYAKLPKCHKATMCISVDKPVTVNGSTTSFSPNIKRTTIQTSGFLCQHNDSDFQDTSSLETEWPWAQDDGFKICRLYIGLQKSNCVLRAFETAKIYFYNK